MLDLPQIFQVSQKCPGAILVPAMSADGNPPIIYRDLYMLAMKFVADFSTVDIEMGILLVGIMGGEVAPAICAYLVGQGSRQMGKMVAAIAEHGMPESEGKLYRWLLDRHQSLAKWRHLLAHGCICQSPNYTDALMVGTSESVISSFAMKGALRYNEKWFESAYIFQESELLALIKCAHRLAHLVRISGDGFLRPELKLPVGQRFDLLLKEPEYVAWALQMGKTSKPAP